MEWTSLVFFTVLSQVAAGLALVYWLCGFTAAAKARPSDYAAFGRHVFLGAGLLTAIATLLSLLHLGWPLSAFRALGNLNSSWLGREALLTALFAALAFGLWLRSRPGNFWPGAPLVLALVGLLATISSGMIYTLPAVPANDNLFPPALFLASAVLAGAVGMICLLHFTTAGRELAQDWITGLWLLTLGALVLGGLLSVTYGSAAAGGLPEARQQAATFTGGALYLARLVVGFLFPGLLALWMAVNRSQGAKAMATAALAAVLAGELAGRWLFFTATTTLAFH